MLNNIDPSLWGEELWAVLHMITIAYPNNPTESDKYHVKNFFDSIQFIIPCQTCRSEYQNNLLKYPLTNEILSSKELFMQWLVNIHNEVNKKTNKSQIDVKYVINKYMKQSSNESIIRIVILILVLVLAIYLTIRMMK